MQALVTKLFSAGVLAAASLAANAQTLLTQIPILPTGLTTAESANVAVNTATNRIYLPLAFYNDSNQYIYQLLVLNGATNQVVKTLNSFPIGSHDFGIAIDPARNLIYLELCIPGATSACNISVINGQTEEIVKTIPLGEGVTGHMVVDPVTGKIYIRALNQLAVIESGATGSADTFSLPEDYPLAGGTGLAISPYAHRLYFTSSTYQGPEVLGFFDTLTDRISQSKTLSSNLFYLSATAVNPETGRLFGITAADQYSGDGVVMFNSAGTLLANIALPVTGAAGNSGTAYAQSVEVDPRTNLAFVSALTDSGVSLGSALYVIDGATNTVLRSTSFYSTFVTSVVGVNPDTGKVYVVYGTSPNSKFYLDVYSEQ